MLYREAGQFKASYAEDARIFPIRQDRIGFWVLMLVFGVAVPLLVLVAGRARHADPKLWTIGAAAGGLGGLIGSLTGITLWTYGGIAAGALFAVFAVRRAAQSRPTAAASPLQPLS